LKALISFDGLVRSKLRGGQICCYTGEPGEPYYLVLDELRLCHTPHQRGTTMCA